MNTATKFHEQLQGYYPDLECVLRSLPKETFASIKRLSIPAGTHLFREEERCNSFMLLLEGTLRVYKHSPEGREITLYRVHPGELCVLSLQSLLCDDGFPAEAVSETKLVGVSLSQQDFSLAIDNSKEFREYLLKTLSQRLSETVQLVSEVTFNRLDLRLACLMGQLFERSGGKPVKITHAQLARELGTTREMISRLLKELEHQECVQLSRGEIRLVSREGLNWFSR